MKRAIRKLALAAAATPLILGILAAVAWERLQGKRP